MRSLYRMVTLLRRTEGADDGYEAGGTASWQPDAKEVRCRWLPASSKQQELAALSGARADRSAVFECGVNVEPDTRLELGGTVYQIVNLNPHPREIVCTLQEVRA